MGNFKEELQRIRQARFGAVPREWPVGRAFLRARADAASTHDLRATVLDWATEKWPGLVTKGAYDGGELAVVQAGLSISAVGIPDQGMWAFRSEHIDREAARTWVTEALVASLEPLNVLGVRNLCSSLSSSEPPASMPRFLRTAISRFAFEDAECRVRDTPTYVRDISEAEALIEMLRHRGRTLPVNVLTMDRNGETTLDPDRLAIQLAGVAHVVVASPEATRLLSDVFGQEFSVFNGAVRTYNTAFDPINDDIYRHPLVLSSKIAAFESPSGAGAAGFQAFLTKTQHDRSVAPTNEFTAFPDFLAVKGRALADRASKAEEAELVPILSEQLKTMEGQRQRWEEHAIELSGQLDVSKSQIAQLQAHIETLTAALDRLQSQERGRTPAEEAEPKDYADMPAWVERELTGRLILHARAVRSLKSAKYEDPSLVVQALKVLAYEFRDLHMATAENREAKLGALDDRLSALGLDRSRAISNERASQFADAYYVEYVIGRTSRQKLVDHLKKGTSKDERYCLRIYYFWDTEQKLVVVGSLPGHLRNRLS